MFRRGYGHFLRTAASLRWDEAGIDLRADAAEWPELEEVDRDRVRQLLAGFVVAERSVARELEPFAVAASAGDPDLAAAFEVQAVDEARHARFFERAMVEVVGRQAADRDLRGLVDPAFVELFEDELPSTARALSEGDEELGDAVALYHLLLEGVVFTAGQLALLELLERIERLPGLRRGTELVLRDERWHIGLGASCLAGIGIDDELADALLGEAERALDAWGGVVEPATRQHVTELHRRRLAAAGLLARRPAYWEASSSGPPSTPLATRTS